jgi:hypothetical protein
MNYRMTSISLLVIIASFMALLVVGTEDMGSGHTVFANRAFSGHGTFTNRGVNVQTDTNQDQGCEDAGGTSGTTNACTATSGRGSSQTSTETQVIFNFAFCLSVSPQPPPFTCNGPFQPEGCNNIGCQSITCTGTSNNPGTCTTDNHVQLTSCTNNSNLITCPTGTETHTIPGTGITQSGGVSGG